MLNEFLDCVYKKVIRHPSFNAEKCNKIAKTIDCWELLEALPFLAYYHPLNLKREALYKKLVSKQHPFYVQNKQDVELIKDAILKKNLTIDVVAQVKNKYIKAFIAYFFKLQPKHEKLRREASYIIYSPLINDFELFKGVLRLSRVNYFLNFYKKAKGSINKVPYAVYDNIKTQKSKEYLVGVYKNYKKHYQLVKLSTALRAYLKALKDVANVKRLQVGIVYIAYILIKTSKGYFDDVYMSVAYTPIVNIEGSKAYIHFKKDMQPIELNLESKGSNEKLDYRLAESFIADYSTISDIGSNTRISIIAFAIALFAEISKVSEILEPKRILYKLIDPCLMEV